MSLLFWPLKQKSQHGVGGWRGGKRFHLWRAHWIVEWATRLLLKDKKKGLGGERLLSLGKMGWQVGRKEGGIGG